jgi:deoxyadenosine/deoxycytidine kinase
LYDYYEELNARYDQWFDEYDASPKIQIDGDQMNFVEDTQAAEEVLNLIEEKLKEVRQEA